jgi:YcxB-like protein
VGELLTLSDQGDPREIVGDSSTLFDLRFILTEAEWREGTDLLHPIFGTAYNPKIPLRLFFGLCGVLNLMIPVLNGWSWDELIREQPQRAALTALVAIACALAAMGIGTKALDRRLNRIDLERHIVVTDRGVTISWNNRVFNHEWKDFVYFRETPNVVILRNPGVRFWTIPLRALPSGSKSRFLDLLHRKMPRRQPYSWSPDSSGYVH